MLGSRSTPLALTALREVAHLYKGFLFRSDLLVGPSLHIGGLSTGSSSSSTALLEAKGARSCARELLQRGKHVAALRSAPVTAAAVLKEVNAAGAPSGLCAWSSGEYLRRCFQMDSEADYDPRPRPLQKKKPVRVFRLSQVSLPRNWKDFERGAQSAELALLPDLEKAGHIRLVTDVEKADVCLWDVPVTHDAGDVLEPILDLCLDNGVVFVQLSRSAYSIKAVASMMARDGPEASAALLGRLGGLTTSMGKLDGVVAGLAWRDQEIREDLTPQEMLLVTDDLGDLAEAEEHGVDALLVMSSRAHGQLGAFAQAEQMQAAAERKNASVSQRLAQDSPAMLHAASNPFFSFLQLPGLIKEVSRRNAEHRERAEAAQAAARARQDALRQQEEEASQRAPTTDKAGDRSTARGSKQLPEVPLEDPMDLLQRWSRGSKVRLPAAVASSGCLQWDEARPNIEEGSGNMQLPGRRDAAHAARLPKERTSCQALRDEEEEVESLQSLLQQMSQDAEELKAERHPGPLPASGKDSASDAAAVLLKERQRRDAEAAEATKEDEAESLEDLIRKMGAEAEKPPRE
eukprot:TRINITY_DN27130_c0_g1_i3.p1 TRINITY_DN27130_c0_g1~~TRINITY_DN27130_c0_g1_i3.p1  ORF type:complete len:575 (+),score=172.62 TRINITY_DN27130_c0_g1_i3:84-1808(+)